MRAFPGNTPVSCHKDPVATENQACLRTPQVNSLLAYLLDDGVVAEWHLCFVERGRMVALREAAPCAWQAACW